MRPSIPATAAARWWTPTAGWSASTRLIYSQSGGSEGIGFAAPSNIVRNVFDQIRKTGRVRRGEIGVTPQTITPLMAEALALTVDAGVVLSPMWIAGQPRGESGPGSPGTSCMSLDGKRMENGRQFRINVYTRAIGELVRSTSSAASAG